MGSLRGQESAACERESLDFFGLDVRPMYRIASRRGIGALLAFLRATRIAKRNLRADRPDVVFSTGGYGSAPAARAAVQLGIPLVLHEQNAVPGRVNRVMSSRAARVCIVFHRAESYFPADKCVRTGMPIRSVLRRTAQQAPPPLDEDRPLVLVMGGSQGSQRLNDEALATSVRMNESPARWIQLTGKAFYEKTIESKAHLAVHEFHEVRPYVEADELAPILASCSVVVCRAGSGTLSELAAFRKPSILVPYPTAHAQHQLRNAEEFEALGAADAVPQDELQSSVLEEKLRRWLENPSRRAAAAEALAKWDIPDSAERILQTLQDSALP